ncbi:pseudaminic acid cytidylyltransferase [Prochlorococcus marinus]|uniref:pseudaminic acid cytidylyltransferase n=1 Tax=Prochlorococcus marinus TaxID=1219 RepID=UPI0022B2B67D|nr:pseudaminic acid cytidylyltransferase [Prochlorococcus marinus]
MKTICVIPARGGSKRIPKKNIKNFHGKPLIAWSIECAIASGLFENVYISTDNQEIAEICSKFGALIPFMRPNEISSDFTSDKEVISHFLNWMKESKLEADILCYLYATAPFITTKTLIGCNEKLLKTNASEVFTVTSFPYPVFRALKKNQDNTLSYMWDKYANSRSQDLPELFHDAGQCYFFNLKANDLYSKRVGYEIDRMSCQDIDTLEDFNAAEKLFSIINYKKIKGL